MRYACWPPPIRVARRLARQLSRPCRSHSKWRNRPLPLFKSKKGMAGDPPPFGRGKKKTGKDMGLGDGFASCKCSVIKTTLVVTFDCAIQRLVASFKRRFVYRRPCDYAKSHVLLMQEQKVPQEKTRTEAGFLTVSSSGPTARPTAPRPRFLSATGTPHAFQCRASPGAASLPAAGGVSSSLLRAQKKRSGI